MLILFYICDNLFFMNIQQLEYIIAVSEHQHFVRAAEFCGVTQPSLSMMIQKLEEELGVQIFDRTKHPIVPTYIGEKIINQARSSLNSINAIKKIIENEQNLSTGTFVLGIIPTVAPYVVPLLIEKQHNNYPDLKLIIQETTTANIIEKLRKGTLDGALLAGPLNRNDFVEYPIYYEKFFAYVSPNDKKYSDKEIDLDTIDINDLWLLENEHCLRSQVERLCNLKQKGDNNDTVHYESGSIETLMHIVDHNKGLTIIPELHAMGLPEEKQDNLRNFKNNSAVREVSLMVSNTFVRTQLLKVIINMIKEVVPFSLQNQDLKKFVVDL